MARFLSTYLPLTEPCRWLRGNHHGHSTRSDGVDEPQVIVRAYEAAGYAYFALSEHDFLQPPDELQPYTTLCILPAVEVTSCFDQTLLYLGAERVLPRHQLTPREIMEQVHAAGGLFIFDHPNWRIRPDYATDELLEGLPGLRGLEIYCGVIERLAGEAKATDRWDRLLSKGWRVFGHATDDQHEPGDYFVGWNQVQWPLDGAVNATGIVDALATGRFYASTGVTIHTIGVSEDGQTIQVAADADEIRWITHEGRICKKSRPPEATLMLAEFTKNKSGRPLAERMTYVRIECLGPDNATAWSQPFWIQPESDQRNPTPASNADLHRPYKSHKQVLYVD